MKLMKFAENFKKIIEERGIKISSISDSTGIPISTLSEWTGGRDPKVSEALIKLSQYLNVSLDELITGSVPAERVTLIESVFEIEGKKYRLIIFNG